MTKKRNYVRRDPLASRRALAGMSSRYNYDGTSTYFSEATLRTMAVEDDARPKNSVTRFRLIAKQKTERQMQPGA